MVRIVLTAIVSGSAAFVALWSYDPVIAVLGAPLIASFVTGTTALLVALIEAAMPNPGTASRVQGFKLGRVP
jgi:hypothetical protein